MNYRLAFTALNPMDATAAATRAAIAACPQKSSVSFRFIAFSLHFFAVPLK